MELSVLILVISRISFVYLEICVVPIGRGFSFFGHGKVMENQNVEKEGAPCRSLKGQTCVGSRDPARGSLQHTSRPAS